MSTATPAKPGTACLGCRRRKLKCTREEGGCTNCMKSHLPCVYPVPETGVKRKRGPYKKDGKARERHLEELVRYLGPKDDAGADRSERVNRAASSEEPTPSGREVLGSIQSRRDAAGHANKSEDLVKDALVALTGSHVSNNEAEDKEAYPLQRNPPSAVQPGGIAQHPTARRIFVYWNIYVTRVDPMLKIIHCPSFGKTLFTATEDLRAAGSVTESLLFAIYHAAVSTCTAREARKRFGEERSALLQRYGRVVESTLADNYGTPVLESLQALVIYIIAMRRDDSLTNVRALFSLAVRMAQLINLHKDPGQDYTPFETEMRRRLWWHICGLESGGAEEGGTRQSSVMDGRNVSMPANLNDIDLDPEATDRPQPRTGVTDMTWALLRWEVTAESNGNQEAIKAEQRQILNTARKKLEDDFVRHLHPSRPMDWLCIAWVEGMLTKCRSMIDFAIGQAPQKDLSPEDRYKMLQASVDIIRLTQAVITYKAVEKWSWYFRGWMQWHAIGTLIAELGYSKNMQFVNNAWAVLDPILADWERVYEAKRDEPAWEHVNTLISRAREKRQQVPVQHDNAQQSASILSAPGHTAVPTAVFSTLWQDNWGQPDNTSAPQQKASHPHAGPASSAPQSMGCAPIMPGQDWDFGYMDGMPEIDFSAFEGVFGDTAWDFSSPSTDFGLGSAGI
ncbi:uncharacterized protein LTR77_009848 [Saxophila tyrrhenica]|uniref:Zn(2)-C6 fungal-type domain-containing protein n=1 Tax=Saxophila tyrrhenica TaxID=1690608 RepID=A0AAV9P057_9PEZI|nr:hypothetical protein LTR77_009848 [Saxophila tyrrhenica]